MIQPLSSAPRTTIDDDEEYDDSGLGEEAERRQIDSQKGKATGAERDDLQRVTSEKLEKAVARLERRLRRAADSIERSLEFLDNSKSFRRRPSPAIWMAEIRTFLAVGLSRRMMATNSGALIRLRLLNMPFGSRALVGNPRGGFLRSSSCRHLESSRR